MRRIALVLGVLSALLVGTVPVGAAAPFPSVIDLPAGFQPEGIAVGRGTTFYVGSLAGAGIFRGDLRTGDGSVLVPGTGRTFVGLKVDSRDRLWVAGGPSGRAYVFDATTGQGIATLTLASGQPTFINDVVVTKDAAWFTDSFQPAIYRVDIGPNGAIGSATRIDLTGEVAFVPNNFNLNGIVATPDGSTLLVVGTASGELYAIDAATASVETVDLGGATLTFGDGLVLLGHTLFVVRGQLNEVAVVELSPDFSSGTVVGVLTDPDLDVPATIARFGNALYAVNARFSTPPTPTTPYSVVRVER